MLTEKVISSFTDAIGKEHVILEQEALQNAAKTNYHTVATIPAIIRPADTEEIKQCLRIANEYKIPVYPVSRGKNIGYGSRVPATDNNVLMELGRLDKILDYNETLGYVTVEPGVTFQQLFNFLRERKSALLISGTGGPVDSSIMGNALERGVGTGLYADRFATICGMEIVLADGSVVSSGFKRFGDSTVANVYRWGMGPSIDGLFSQSNFGIVTRLTLWLMPCPEYMQLIFYKNYTHEKIPGLMNALRELAMNGLIRPAVTVYNDFRVFSAMMQYPWQSCKPGINSADDVRAAIRKYPGVNDMVGLWNGEVSIRSVSREHGKMQYDLIKSFLEAHVDTITCVEVSKAEIMALLEEQYTGNFKGHGDDIIKSFLVRKYSGIPDNLPVRAVYWRKKTAIPEVLNPDTDSCGLIWLSPVLPFDGAEVQKAVGIITRIIERYGFEPAITFQCLTERAINVIISISWDRDIAGEDLKAEQCYLELNKAMNDEGFFSYRTTTLGMANKAQAEKKGDYEKFIGSIKTALDPNNILAPGRYNIG